MLLFHEISNELMSCLYIANIIIIYNLFSITDRFWVKYYRNTLG